ncbi:MAG: PQQ-binding-like beta-propeller repeat protein [Deltaproteobacteria bacterium]|nr:PQQ-binding-like beta-propeller repeat protein [Deltaproteobacteria bacterium]
MRLAVAAALLLAAAAPAHARTVRGLVFDDTNGDGRPQRGEPGVANAVVAVDVARFAVTDADGRYELEVPAGARGIVWVRVPDGFRPGPVWGRAPAGDGELDLALSRLAAPHRGPITFVAAADTHMTGAQPFALELARAADDAVAFHPAPAFFTILGDVTQGSSLEQFGLVEAQLTGLAVPYIPVPGNHDWYDGGEAWFAHYGPDNYSFDIGRIHFVVWNMAMSETDIGAYLGAELRHVAPDMTVVALTHAPPVPSILRTLRRLGVAYVLSGHTHTNRAVDHGGLVELTTEPMLMGGLDFTPAGYRIVTLVPGSPAELVSEHRTVVDVPRVAIVAPGTTGCVSPASSGIVVAADLDAASTRVTARLDCGTPVALAYAGGRTWRYATPALAPGSHTLSVEAASPSGARAARTITFTACAQLEPPAPAAAWAQLGGGPGHTGAWPHVLAPPLATRWAGTVGGNILHAAPAIADGAAFVTATDLADGDTGGVAALDLATGGVRWRTATVAPVRGGPAYAAGVVAVAQLDGAVLGLDARTGAVRWRYELGAGLPPEAATVFAAPAADGDDFLVGNQRHFAVLEAATGARRWTADPVPTGENTQSLASVAIGAGVVVGVFHRELGGAVAWDRDTGRELWRAEGDHAVAVNASPVIAGDTAYLVNGATEVTALDVWTGEARWSVKLDPTGFDWGYATIGTPAIADGILVVPTLYRDLVALDAATGAELWRHTAAPGPLRTTHYRGAREAGYASSPVIAGGVVWAADTSGRLVALELFTGAKIWQTELETPVLAGLAIAGNRLVVASYDGSVRLLGPAIPVPPAALMQCDPPAPSGCCGAAAGPGAILPGLAALAVALRRRATRLTSRSGSPRP